ncbi:UNVERIFIED_CONTAM: hypothetical protein FKN15_038031 [Acipenser sinensis]
MGASHAGVMKHVGDAVRDYTISSSSKDGKIVAIGIATWGIVHNRKCLGKFPAEYTLDEESQGRLSCLDTNHSHFILVDNGTHGKYSVEIALRGKLEKFICEQTLGSTDNGIKIPVVCVVLEGGPGTLDTIYSAMMNGTPCVVMEGSGRVADVIAQVANLPLSEITISHIQKQLKTYFAEDFKTFSDIKILEWTKKGKFPAEYTLDEESQGRLSCLDTSHSHFILVDNGTHGKYSVEIALRGKLEKLIYEQTLGSTDNGIKIPVVCVVLEGGPGTLDTIYSAMMNGTPCVVMEGSGRVADVIAQVANLPLSEITISHIQKQLKTYFAEDFKTFSDFKILEWTKKDTVRMQQLLTVFRLEKEDQNDVDVAIIKALLKASKSLDNQGKENWDHQLKLAVAWNRVDIAKSEIFTDDKQWKSIDLSDVMLAALLGDKPDFVKLFLENGVHLKEFLTEKRLLALYNNLPPTSLLLRRILKKQEEEKLYMKKPRSIQLYHVSDVLLDLLGGITKPLYPRPRDRSMHAVPIPHIRINLGSNDLESFQNSIPMDTKGSIVELLDPTRDLFIWAILENRKEIADIIWQLSQDCIATALAASKILKELAKEDTDLSEDMGELLQSNTRNKPLVGVFTECHRRDELRAQKLLTQESGAWGNTTCLRLAVEANNKNFVAQGGVQTLLTQIWWGELVVDTRMWKVLLCMFLFPLIYTGLITFRALSEENLKPLTRLTGFYSSPAVIFYWNVLSYFGFLWLFAYVLMIDFQVTPSWKELLLYIWLFTLVCEEIRQMKDIFFFLFLLVVWVVAYGVANQAILVHNEERLEWIFRGAVYEPYLTIFGHIPEKIDKEKLPENEETMLLSWEAFMKENYLADLRNELNQSTDNKIRDTSEKVGMMVDSLERDKERQYGIVEKRLAHLEEQALQSAKALNWIMNALKNKGYGCQDEVPLLLSNSKSIDTADMNSTEESDDGSPQYHLNARQLLYPASSVKRFPVPDEKVPWEVHFAAYSPTIYNSDSVSRANSENHKDWKRSSDDSVSKTGTKKVLEFIAIKCKEYDCWAFPGGVLQVGETLPKRLKQLLNTKLQEKMQSMLGAASKVTSFEQECERCSNHCLALQQFCE